MNRIYIFILVAIVWATKAFAFQLDLPVACEVGANCWVQQYVDHDASASVADYTCGSASYDGHDGTDFRVLNTTSEVDVLAAADGEVTGLRDGVEDHLLRNETDAKAVQNIECGNGVLLRHGDGFETQYCHLQRGSVAVKKGDIVQRGARLGRVGFSGKAAFPHLHFKVQKAGFVRDPFEGEATANCTGDEAGLWSPQAKAALKYAASNVLHFAWSDKPISLQNLELGQTVTQIPNRQWPALVAVFWGINLRAGDQISLAVTGPEGLKIDNAETLERNKAQYLFFAGRKRRGTTWPTGKYVAEVTVRNNGTVRIQQRIEAILD